MAAALTLLTTGNKTGDEDEEALLPAAPAPAASETDADRKRRLPPIEVATSRVEGAVVVVLSGGWEWWSEVVGFGDEDGEEEAAEVAGDESAEAEEEEAEEVAADWGVEAEAEFGS